MNKANMISWSNVDEFVEAYESAREQSAQTNFVDFLPSADHDLYRAVASELIRVDMEYSWNSGQNRRLQQYQELVPKVLNDHDVLQQVAFEEYRLRLRAGENVSSAEYKSRYRIDTDHWPQEIATTNVHASATDSASDSSNPELLQEALVLADNVQNFPAAGDRFLNFNLQQEIGRGAFARVFLAQQGDLADRLVVLKVASGHSLEPQHLARLQHTNIVPIYSVHRQEEMTAVCMPFFGTRTFGDLLDTVRRKSDAIAEEQNLISTFLNRDDPTQPIFSSTKIPPVSSSPGSNSRVLKVLTESSHVDAVIWLMKQVAEGISHAHQRGIIHRDIKPANILLTNEGLPLVLDFNLSENVVVNGRTALLVGGTLPYMSPEHLEAVTSGKQIGFQTDLFSLGVIFFELLTGQRPFPDRKGSFDEVIREMISDRKNGCPSVQSLNRVVPSSIASLVDRCLAYDVKDRYRTTEELTDDLHRHLCHQPLLYAPDRSIAERSKKWLKRHPRMSSGAGVAAIAGILLATVVGLWLLRGQHLARLEAEATFETFRQQQPSLYMALGVPQSESQLLRDSLDSTRQSLTLYGVLDDDNWQEQAAYQSLPASEREELQHRLGELLYLAARANDGLGKFTAEGEPRETLLDQSLRWNRLAVNMFSKKTCPQALLLQQADLLDMQGAADLADELRRQAAEQQSSDVIDQYAKVYELLDSRDYLAAKPLLTTLRDRSPTDPLPWLLLGDSNAALGALNDSEGCLTTAVALHPESYLGYYHRGRCRFDLRQYEDALSDFEKVIQLRPQLACGFLNRALTHKAIGNYQDAITDLTMALELGATQTRIYFLRAELYQRLNDADHAKQDIDTGLSLTPTDELSWVARGVAKLEQDENAALADFQQAIQLNPISRVALRNCVHVLADRLDRPQEAFEAINRLLAINENDADALASRSVLYARQGNRQAAMTDLRQLLRVSKKPKALFQAACTLSLTSSEEEMDNQRAIVLLARAVLAEPIWLYRARTDPDLENLRHTDGYQRLVADSRKFNTMNLNLNKQSQSKTAATID